MIAGVSVEVGREAVVLVSERPLRVLSSAVHHGGFVDARAVVNLHVGKNDPCTDPAGMIAAFAARVGVPAPWVGLLTGALTERAAVVLEGTEDLRALAVTTVGLNNLVSAGPSPISAWTPSTVNTLGGVGADPEPAALRTARIPPTAVKAPLPPAAGRAVS